MATSSRIEPDQTCVLWEIASLMNNYAEYAKDIEQLVPAAVAGEFYGLDVNRRQFVSCPFHTEKTASFYAKGSYFYCYGCGWHGNVVDFVRDYFGMTWLDALAKVNDDFRLNLPIGRRATLTETNEAKRRWAERDFIDAVESCRKRSIDSLWDEWIRLDRTVIEQKPSGPYDAISDEYVNALKRIDYVSYLIDLYDRGCYTRRL